MRNNEGLALCDVVNDFAAAFKAVDSAAPQGSSRTRVYRPGIGPLTEAEAIRRAVNHLQSVKPETYMRASPMRYPGAAQVCDLVVPSLWAIEFKLIRPYGDNGDPAEHWSGNILYPYPGNVSTIGDCIKLVQSAFPERRAVIVFGYEHDPPVTPLTVAVTAFETIVANVVGPAYDLVLTARHTAVFDHLIHPVHQRGSVFGWEVCPTTSSVL